MKKFITILVGALAVVGFISCSNMGGYVGSNENSSVQDDYEARYAEAEASLAAVLASGAGEKVTDGASATKVKLPEHKARLFDHQAVVLPNGSSVITSVYQRDGIDFLWVSEKAPVGIFNRTLLDREQGNVADGDDFVFEYYYLMAKPDFYQNKLTAVEITAEEYMRIIAAYSAQ